MTAAKTRFIVAILFLFAFISYSTTTSASNINMNDGLWEISTKMDMANLPFAIPPMTYTSCLTKEDLIPVRSDQAEQNECKVTQQKIHADTISWTVVCDMDEGKITSSGTVTYKGDSFHGEMTVAPEGGGSMHQTMSGRRIGPCD
ncbi:MAG: DUF3617 domain-containing protein [Desulfuromusa sp.]|nr:DUF3617 domain-containing protein [Desulfuromusa sp.]